MFIGHYAVGFGARGSLPATARQPSLGTWFLAVQWLDLVWPILVVAGVERVRIVAIATNPFLNLDFVSYPWSHSLLASVVWGALFAAVYRWRTGNGTSAVLLGLGVVSHWVLDFITHVPDLPIYPGGAARVGLGLWTSVPATLSVEGGLSVLGLAWYLARTRARDRAGTWGVWTLVAFLALVYVASLVSPPPPSEMAIGVSGLLLWLLPPWAYWIDRHRAPRA